MTESGTLCVGASADSAPLLSAKRELTAQAYVTYVGLVILATIALKLALTPLIPYSHALTDDYDYMYKTLCFLKGDWQLTSYQFKKVYTGPAYPLLISPWVLFDHPRAKMLCIYAIHFLLSAGVIAIGTSLVTRLSGRRSLLVPLVLATYAPTFLHNYYVITENLLFFLLILTLWLAVDFEATCRKAPRLLLFLAICCLMPLTRTPGYAIVPASMVLLLVNYRRLGWTRTLLIASAVIICAITPEQYFYHFMYEAERLGNYAEGFSRHLEKSATKSTWQPVLFLALSFLTQLKYVFLTTGVWMLPAFVLALFMTRKLPQGPRRTAWNNLLCFALALGLALLAFSQVHISMRASMDLDWVNFVIGRYVDPGAVVLGIVGLCAFMSIRRLRATGWVLMAAVVPICLYFTLRAFDDRVYHPLQDIGLSAMALGKLRDYPAGFFWVPIALVATVGMLSRNWRVAQPVMLALVIAFNVLTVHNGLTYSSQWSLRVAGTLESAEWTIENLPKDAKILCDRTQRLLRPPPGLAGWNWRNVYNVYRAYVVLVHPIQVRYVKDLGDPDADFHSLFGDGEYLLSVSDASPAVDWGFPVVWENFNYVMYRLEPSTRRHIHQIRFADFEVSRERMYHQRGTQLVMAWHNCTATLREPLSLPTGRYELALRATGEGCDDPPPKLVVEIPGMLETTLDVVPNTTRRYTIPFELTDDGSIGLHLTAIERPHCADGSDKNVYIESVFIERFGDDPHGSELKSNGGES